MDYFETAAVTAAAGEKETMSVVDSVITGVSLRDPLREVPEKKAEPTPKGDVGCFASASGDDNGSTSASTNTTKRNLLDLRQETKSNASLVESFFVAGAQTLLALGGATSAEEDVTKAVEERAVKWDRDLDYSFNGKGRGAEGR